MTQEKGVLFWAFSGCYKRPLNEFDTFVMHLVSSNITIAGIFDRTSFHWGKDIFDFVFQELTLIYPYLNYVVRDAECDETTAVRAYWDLRVENNGIPVNGIVGARCSGASVSLARIAGLEGVHMVSPSATSAMLSNKDEFPFFSRTVAPDNSEGEVGALVETLNWFGWKRVSILSTDTIYVSDCPLT